MRCARLLSWTLFVLFFLVYLTAIKLVRGDRQQQHWAQQVGALYAPHYTYQTPLKQARELANYVAFDQGQVAQLAAGHQPVSRRHHLGLAPAGPSSPAHQFASQSASTGTGE